jgi:hypothetical protein
MRMMAAVHLHLLLSGPNIKYLVLEGFFFSLISALMASDEHVLSLYLCRKRVPFPQKVCRTPAPSCCSCQGVLSDFVPFPNVDDLIQPVNGVSPCISSVARSVAIYRCAVDAAICICSPRRGSCVIGLRGHVRDRHYGYLLSMYICQKTQAQQHWSNS